MASNLSNFDFSNFSLTSSPSLASSVELKDRVPLEPAHVAGSASGTTNSSSAQNVLSLTSENSPAQTIAQMWSRIDNERKQKNGIQAGDPFESFHCGVFDLKDACWKDKRTPSAFDSFVGGLSDAKDGKKECPTWFRTNLDSVDVVHVHFGSEQELLHAMLVTKDNPAGMRVRRCPRERFTCGHSSDEVPELCLLKGSLLDKKEVDVRAAEKEVVDIVEKRFGSEVKVDHCFGRVVSGVHGTRELRLQLWLHSAENLAAVIGDSKDICVLGADLHKSAPNATRELRCFNCGQAGHRASMCDKLNGPQWMLRVVTFTPISETVGLQRLILPLKQAGLSPTTAFTGVHEGRKQPSCVCHLAFADEKSMLAAFNVLLKDASRFFEIAHADKGVAKRNICGFCGQQHEASGCPAKKEWCMGEKKRTWAGVTSGHRMIHKQASSRVDIKSFDDCKRIGACWSWVSQGRCEKFGRQQCNFGHKQAWRCGRFLCHEEQLKSKCNRGSCSFFHAADIAQLAIEQPASDQSRKIQRSPQQQATASPLAQGSKDAHQPTQTTTASAANTAQATTGESKASDNNNAGQAQPEQHQAPSQPNSPKPSSRPPSPTPASQSQPSAATAVASSSPSSQPTGQDQSVAASGSPTPTPTPTPVSQSPPSSSSSASSNKESKRSPKDVADETPHTNSGNATIDQGFLPARTEREQQKLDKQLRRQQSKAVMEQEKKAASEKVSLSSKLAAELSESSSSSSSSSSVEAPLSSLSRLRSNSSGVSTRSRSRPSSPTKKDGKN